MSTRIYIDDDGDERCFIRVEEEVIATIDHETYGWSGMRAVIELVEEIAETFGIPITNHQDIV